MPRRSRSTRSGCESSGGLATRRTRSRSPASRSASRPPTEIWRSSGRSSALSMPAPAPDRVHRGLEAVVDLELHEDVRDVVLDGLGADVEVGGEHGVVLAVRD